MASKLGDLFNAPFVSEQISSFEDPQNQIIEFSLSTSYTHPYPGQRELITFGYIGQGNSIALNGCTVSLVGTLTSPVTPAHMASGIKLIPRVTLTYDRFGKLVKIVKEKHPYDVNGNLAEDYRMEPIVVERGGVSHDYLNAHFASHVSAIETALQILIPDSIDVAGVFSKFADVMPTNIFPEIRKVEGEG